MLCALSMPLASWAQGYGTGAAGRSITPGSIPSSITPSMARTGSGSSDGGGAILSPNMGTGPIPTMKKYLLGPQDVISVTIERFPDYSTNNIIIPPDGLISLPYFRPQSLNVNGMTAPQLEAILTKRINNRIRNPQITVSIQRMRSASEGYVQVIGGGVQAQGPVEILRTSRLTEVLAKAGGVRGRYDEVAGFVSRGSKRIPVDLYQAELSPQGPANIHLKADDVLTVNSVDPGSISVSGDVARQGVYELHRAPVPNAPELPLKPRLSDLIVAVGGFINNDKLLNGRISGFVQRGHDKIELRVSDAINFKDETANIELKPNDFVTFSVELPLSVNVLGLVRVQGNYRVRPGSGVLDAITIAGGLARDPLQIVAVLHRDGMQRTIDLPKLIAGDTTQNLTLEAGDTLTLDSPDTLQVSIAGAVSEPSKGDGLSLPPGSTIHTALARAGGIRQGLQLDRTAITIIRTMPDGGQRFLTVDPVALQERNDQSQNVKLQDGDIINVLEKRQRQASISGEVVKAGPYTIDEDGEDLATFIAGAGGVRDTALLSAVSIKGENGSVKTVDAYDAVTNGRPLNVKVRENDLVLIPENQSRILINGAVQRQGIVPLPERRPLTILDAIAGAGGALPGARLQEIVLVRARLDSQGNATPEPPRRLNLRDVRNGNIADARLTLQDGDIIVVPEAKPKQDPIGKGLGLFSIFNIARTLTR